jgi:hypothetical protein
MPADILRHLQSVYRYSTAEITRRSAILGPDCTLGPSFFINLRNSGAIPSLHHIYAIAEVFHLTLGSAFSIFGIDLDALVRAEVRLNRDRTRLIEGYIFDRNRPIQIPARLHPSFGERQTMHLQDLVPAWRSVPAYTIVGTDWQRPDIFYARLGRNDTNAAPDIPAGAGIQVRRLQASEIRRLSRDAYYFVQHPWGYMACRCEYREGALILISNNPSYPGPHQLRYGREVIILGEILAFCAALPTVPYHEAMPLPRMQQLPHAIAPWTHTSFSDLFAVERLRLRLGSDDMERAGTQLEAIVGHTLSGRYALGLDLQRHVPHTSTALILSIVASIRLSDMLRSLRIEINDAGKYDVRDLLAINDRAALPELLPPAPAPVPRSAWERYLRHAGEWPMPLTDFIHHLSSSSYEILQIDQSRRFPGLDSLLHPGSYLAILPSISHSLAHDRERPLRDWARPLYVVERLAPVPAYYCGYLSQTNHDFFLWPHPDSDEHSPLAFRKDQARIVGNVAGVASRFA